VLVTELTVPHADAALIRHSTQLLKQVLPSLFQPSDSLENVIKQMAIAVTQNTNNYCLAREQKAAEAEASDKFTITLDILQEYLEVPHKRNLPTLWHFLIVWLESRRLQRWRQVINLPLL
jgi:hypothetical protein